VAAGAHAELGANTEVGAVAAVEARIVETLASGEDTEVEADVVDAGLEDAAEVPPAMESKGIFTAVHDVLRVFWSSASSF
jgi:hypothetical protein